MGNLFIALLWLTSSLSQGRQNTTVDTVMYHRTCMIFLELYIMCIQKTTRPIVAKEWRMDHLYCNSCFELTLYHWVVRCELLSDHDIRYDITRVALATRNQTAQPRYCGVDDNWSLEVNTNIKLFTSSFISKHWHWLNFHKNYRISRATPNKCLVTWSTTLHS